jgi:protein disulfide-isomerase
MQHLKHYYLVLGLVTAATAPGAEWRHGAEQSTVAAAAEQAKREGKVVMFNFTGSDWCSWCIKLKQEVFTQPEFESFARDHLVLVEVDFPRRTAQTEALKAANQEAAKRMGVTGYPTLVLFNSDGKEIGRSGYKPGGAAAFIRETTRLINSPAAQPSARSAAPPRELPPFGGAATQPPIRFTNLALKTISGTANRRFALLNDQTLTAGETLPVKLLDGKVNVRCVEIREQSVIVDVQGEKGPREIRLRRGTGN